MTRDELLLRVASGEIPVTQAVELLASIDKPVKPAVPRKSNPKAPSAHAVKQGLEWPVWCEKRDGVAPHPTSRIVSDTEVLLAVSPPRQ